MADRIFAGVLLVVSLAYAVIAFTAISAPFQYDPLGPESWPRLLAIVAIVCLLIILWKPDTDSLGVTGRTWFRLAATIILLVAYAELYEPLGFIVSTILFGTTMAAMLGAGILRSAAFGLAAGIAGYLLCVMLLDLNLPAGEIFETLFEPSSPAASEGES
ncbi:tripartite tricarboxylate transporter TctB family protein [Palleronia sp. LCG004]|uniref:tripartite tricarboxylate transporter TctB family protein n=1 Tax=Palleronia sp. LCG004 TaxID=3079304 RepID=UPI002942F535|nr:tripartite tricarboxylate transporter TctB family protein [Palleronia sp. LCG004]WOI57963.1 tripartite tricarboxylate transporter TctB family protein [Palleronia sp. LCG004]